MVFTCRIDVQIGVQAMVTSEIVASGGDSSSWARVTEACLALDASFCDFSGDY